jgi:hypothetical protein
METYLVKQSEAEHTLDRLWETREEKNKNRASLFNLIFYTPQNERTPYIRSLLSKIIEKFPARIFFIVKNSGQSPEMLTRVCVLPAPHEADFACDLIEVEIGDKGEAQVNFLLLAHLLPDLPIVTVWADQPFTDSLLFHQLELLSDRMIFDSAVTTDPASFAQKILKSKCDISDLTWTRLQNWRKLLSTTFHAQERLEMLYEAKEVIILYNSLGEPLYAKADLQALYLQTWLFCALGWKKEEVSCHLIAEPQSALPPGSVISLDIMTSGQRQFSFGRDLQIPHQISMRFSSLILCDIPLKYYFPKTELGHSLITELSRSGTSPHLLDVLQTLCSTLPSS